MTGSRILLAVVALAGLLLWAALAGGRDEDLARGIEQTEQAFAHVDAELAALDPDFQSLLRQGLVLGLREEHTRIRDQLARQRTRSVAIESDAGLDRRQRLPQLRDLVDEIDGTLQLAVVLRRRCAALVAHRAESRPLVERARTLQARIDERRPESGTLSMRAATLATSLTDKAEQVEIAEKLIRENAEQGARFSSVVVADLNRLVAEQERLLGELP